MSPIPPAVKAELLADPRMKVCARAHEGNCSGRITWEHAIIFAGKQVQEAWAILGICAFHHGVDEFQDRGDMNKEKHEWLALRQAPPGRLLALSKATDYYQRLSYLNKVYA